jgi:hypothetical protein
MPFAEYESQPDIAIMMLTSASWEMLAPTCSSQPSVLFWTATGTLIYCNASHNLRISWEPNNGGRDPVAPRRACRLDQVGCSLGTGFGRIEPGIVLLCIRMDRRPKRGRGVYREKGWWSCEKALGGQPARSRAASPTM